MSKGKREKFVSLANKRVNIALKRLDLIGNLASKNNYEYSDQDVKKIFKALDDQISEIKSRFNGQGKKDQEFRI